jgi:hypothetical protein
MTFQATLYFVQWWKLELTHTKRNADNTYSQFYSLKMSDSQWVVRSERYLYCMMWTFFRYSTSRRCISCRDAPTYSRALMSKPHFFWSTSTRMPLSILTRRIMIYLNIPSRYQLGTWLDPGGSSRFVSTENWLPISLKSSSCTEDTYTQRACAGMISILVALAVLAAETDNHMKCRHAWQRVVKQSSLSLRYLRVNYESDPVVN